MVHRGVHAARLRLYVERYLKDDGSKAIEEVLAPLLQFGKELLKLRERFGRDEATVIT